MVGMPLRCRLVTITGRDDHQDGTNATCAVNVPRMTVQSMARAHVPLRAPVRLEETVSLCDVIIRTTMQVSGYENTKSYRTSNNAARKQSLIDLWLGCGSEVVAALSLRHRVRRPGKIDTHIGHKILGIGGRSSANRAR